MLEKVLTVFPEAQISNKDNKILIQVDNLRKLLYLLLSMPRISEMDIQDSTSILVTVGNPPMIIKINNVPLKNVSDLKNYL